MKAIFRVPVPPLPRFSSATSTRVPAFSPFAEAMPEEVVAAAGAAAGVDAGTGADEVVATDDVVAGEGAAVFEIVYAFFSPPGNTRNHKDRKIENDLEGAPRPAQPA